jgi:dipeptidyl aminopeptidase/acylaminoacyl peptidase
VILAPPSTPVMASEGLEWLVPLKVTNMLEAGIYGDSLTCVTEDLDPGQTRTSRFRRVTSTSVVSVLQSLGRLDSTIIRYKAPATAEHAHLTFTLYTHTQTGERHQSTGSCETVAGISTRRFQSEFIQTKSGRVETVLLPEPWPVGRSPGILLVHPEGMHARKLIGLAWYLANRGATVMLVSQPGYGLSDGKPDLAGPRTVEALARALDRLRHASAVDTARIAVWGISTGATAAAMLATSHHDLAAVVLQSGFYDLGAVFRDTRDDSLKRALQKEGGGKGGWRKRSPVLFASGFRAPVLFVHGELDSIAPANQAMEFAGKLRAQGVDVRIETIPRAGHGLESNEVMTLVQPFLKERLGLEK